MPEHIPYLRIFLSSPGDVNEERKIAIEVIEALPYRPAFRDKVAFRVIAWDRPGADTPMLASLTPQEAINRGLPKPSDCDITLVLFWKRMGTPFVDTDGTPYESGTHWELMDALKSADCETLIYRRTEKVQFDVDDTAGQEQYRRVRAFFDSELFYKDGRILRGVNVYDHPEDFRVKFQTHIEDVIVRVLAALDKKKDLRVEPPSLEPSPNIITVEKVAWQPGKSPFPGLRPFTKDDAAIFFGRGRETDELVRHIATSRFVSVVGASGSGKSSLVGAGLLPRLNANAISDEKTGSKDWVVVQFTPGQSDHPFAALFEAMIKTFEPLRPSPLDLRRVKMQFVQDMLADPKTVCDALLGALEMVKAPAWAEVLLFIDQFEELFTLAKSDSIVPFAAMLTTLAEHPRLRVIVTIRHDFVHRAIEIPELAALLNLASFHLAAPTTGALIQMMKRPAEIAGIEFEEGLPEQIVSEMGSDAGALALLAYALDELYDIATQRGDQRLTFADYVALGGVEKAIGKRAEQTFADSKLPDKETLLGQVFRELVEVDERGTATRQRCPLVRFDEQAMPLVQAFTAARLLVIDGDEVEVAHEALFSNWQRLKNWIEANREALYTRRRLMQDTDDWLQAGREAGLLATGTRLAQFETFVATTTLLLSADAHAYVEASVKQQEEAINRLEKLTREAKEATQQSELASQRARRNRTIALIVGLVAFILAVGASLISANAVNQANAASTREAGANEQSTLAVNNANGAGTQVAVANNALTNVPPTLTYVSGQVAIAREQAAQAGTQVADANATLAPIPGTLAAADAQLSRATATLGYVQGQGTQVAAQATYFGIEQARIGTLAAGAVVIPPGTLTPELLLPTLTGIAQLRQWEPRIIVEEIEGIPIEMVEVPPGCFMMGSVAGGDEGPVHEQCFTEPFYIDRYEVTQGQFKALNGIMAEDFAFPGENRPVETINWFEARDFCQARDARLPTEREWEYAARGPDSLTYPWGNVFVPENVVYNRVESQGTADVVGEDGNPARLGGASWVGALDMSGNVFEWTSTRYDDLDYSQRTLDFQGLFPYPYLAEDGREADETQADFERRVSEQSFYTFRVVRGGSWLGTDSSLRGASRNWNNPDNVNGVIGFRCARSS